ncbi:MAG: STAS domain-containing protein [Rhodocyclaceae bacterium]|jgi:anti-anti-sigma factor|nr:STAS domain-containing protein [Rhodocyclaceae bacterium]
MTEFATQATTDGALHLILDGPMTIYNAAEIKAQLLNGVQTANILELDLSHVGEIDTAGFQLLVMAKRESQRLEHTLRIIAHSPAVREVIDFYNMDAFFGDPIVIPADH